MPALSSFQRTGASGACGMSRVGGASGACGMSRVGGASGACGMSRVGGASGACGMSRVGRTRVSRRGRRGRGCWRGVRGGREPA
ncbi:hypothetical protein CH299_08275 [Rhodococcus sp. 14-2686-1-2]|nr:hypothetical protein CH301_07725 [Rhodococcus sp. 15-1189-1-1a]OZF17116.1 hypothetical protein CH299_08275 [Rhodococcus sp. 14-2686-1-2]